MKLWAKIDNMWFTVAMKLHSTGVSMYVVHEVLCLHSLKLLCPQVAKLLALDQISYDTHLVKMVAL